MVIYQKPYSDLWDELKEEIPNMPKRLQILKRIFEDLVATTNPISVREVDNFCSTIYVKDKYFNKLPERLQEIIKEGMTLHDWTTEPRYCIATPDEMLAEINEILSEYEDV